MTLLLAVLGGLAGWGLAELVSARSRKAFFVEMSKRAMDSKPFVPDEWSAKLVEKFAQKGIGGK